MLLQREEKEAPKWELKEKKPSSARAVHHHPNTATTGEQTSFACKNITRFIQILAFRSRSTFAKKPNSRHHFCANQTVSLPSARAKAPRTERKSTRKRKREKQKVYSRTRVHLFLSRFVRERDSFASFRTNRSLERERETARGTRRERRTMMNFVFFCARILCGNVRKKDAQKKGRRHECVSVIVPHTAYLSRDKVGDAVLRTPSRG